MPKITTHGGATNAGEPGYFEDIEAAQAEPTPSDDTDDNEAEPERSADAEPAEVLRIEDEPKPAAKKLATGGKADATPKGATDA